MWREIWKQISNWIPQCFMHLLTTGEGQGRSFWLQMEPKMCRCCLFVCLFVRPYYALKLFWSQEPLKNLPRVSQNNPQKNPQKNPIDNTFWSQSTSCACYTPDTYSSLLNYTQNFNGALLRPSLASYESWWTLSPSPSPRPSCMVCPGACSSFSSSSSFS